MAGVKFGGIGIGLLVGAIAAAAVAGQDATIGSWTVDAGGGVVSAGSYTMRFTIGQHDAHRAAQSGAYMLTGGFWAGADESRCNVADLAPPFGLLDLADVVAFSGGFVSLEPIADLNADGLFDLSDIAAFIASFVAGCP